MFDLFLLVFITIIIISPITYSFITLLRSILQFPSYHVYQLLISASALIIWTIIVIPIYVAPESLNDSEIILIEHISTIIGSIGVLFFIFSIINTFSYRDVFFPRATIVGFSIIIGSKLIQLVLPPTETIYGIRIEKNELIRVSPPYFSVMIFISYVCLYISLILFIKKQNVLPSYLVAQKIKQYSIYSLVVMTIGMIFQTFGTIIVMDANFAGWFLLCSRLFITTGFIFIVLEFTKNPILNFSENGNPKQFIMNGVVNWLLIGNRNLGPESLSKSSAVEQFFNKEELQLLTIKLLTSISIGREKFGEEICIIPYSTNFGNFIAIGFSFLHKDYELTDPRKNSLCQLLFAVIIPNKLLAFFQNLDVDAMRGPIMAVVNKSFDLKEFSTTNFNELTSILLRNLSSKKVF